mmetsp:Transcript_111549/g.311834  ORF Transcript_111549/g.311834 Transcript_111549/m.311834 type:complete len:170 (+) Transcript_111549:222-731(+)
MKPDWDKLMAEYKEHKSVVIADVDCTAEGKSLCDEQGVQGFPTIKYGDPNNLQDYEGGRDFDALEAFAKENLGPTCSPANLELCSPEQKATVEKFMAMPFADLKKLVEEKDAELKKADEDFDEMLKGLQAEYESGEKKKEEEQKKIKDAGLGIMKSVQAQRNKGTKSDL